MKKAGFITEIASEKFSHISIQSLLIKKHPPRRLSLQAPECSQPAGGAAADRGPLHPRRALAARRRPLPRLHLPPLAPQRHPELGLPGDGAPLQGALATAEGTRPQDPPRPAGPGGPSLLRAVQGDGAAGAGAARPAGAGGGAGHQGGPAGPGEPLGEEEPELR